MRKIILIMGHLASLKSSVAKRLANDFNILCFCKDDIVLYNGNYYIALMNNQGYQPDINPVVWELYVE
jgi:dephospho-CoA kinase